jgi:hypothetical protein
MIKNQDKRSDTRDGNRSIFIENKSALGIAFEKSNGTKRFVPAPFLSAIDYNGNDELVFRYPFATITVKGSGLRPLWDAARQGILATVIETGVREEEPSVIAIVILDQPDSSISAEQESVWRDNPD